ncbi:hypothetical protein BDW72DRAFT_168013 [Aspergillus terricola var. indicus]
MQNVSGTGSSFLSFLGTRGADAMQRPATSSPPTPGETTPSLLAYSYLRLGPDSHITSLPSSFFFFRGWFDHLSR